MLPRYPLHARLLVLFGAVALATACSESVSVPTPIPEPRATTIDLTVDLPVRDLGGGQEWTLPVLGHGQTAKITAVVRDQQGRVMPDAPIKWSTIGRGVMLHPGGGQVATVQADISGVNTIVAESDSARAEVRMESLWLYFNFSRDRIILDDLEVGTAVQVRMFEQRRGLLSGVPLAHRVADTTVAVLGSTSTSGEHHRAELIPRKPGTTAYEVSWMGAVGSVPLEVLDTASIAFTTSRDGAFEVYTMRPNGTNLRNVTNHPAADHNASWSPDRTQLVFTSDRHGNDEIYTINIDGTGLKRLTDHSASDDWPAWSPDGKRIAFSSTRSGTRAIYVMNVDGTGVTKITPSAFDQAVADRPKWSPDGSRIAFQSARSGNFDIYTVASSGAGAAIQITRDPKDEEAPDWAPIGNRIAFQMVEWGPDCITGFCRIGLVQSDGSDLRFPSYSGGSQMHPSWSRDAKRLAYVVLQSGNFDVYTLWVDSYDNYIRVTDHEGLDGAPAWWQ